MFTRLPLIAGFAQRRRWVCEAGFNIPRRKSGTRSTRTLWRCSYILAFIPRRRDRFVKAKLWKIIALNIHARSCDSVADNEPRRFAITNINAQRHRGYQIASCRLRVASPISRGVLNLVIVVPSNSKRFSLSLSSRSNKIDDAINTCSLKLPQNSIRHDALSKHCLSSITWSFGWCHVWWWRSTGLCGLLFPSSHDRRAAAFVRDSLEDENLNIKHRDEK